MLGTVTGPMYSGEHVSYLAGLRVPLLLHVRAMASLFSVTFMPSRTNDT